MEGYHVTSVRSSRFKEGRMLAIAAVYRRATLMRAVVCQQRQAAPAEAALGASRTRHFERAASLRRSCSCTV